MLVRVLPGTSCRIVLPKMDAPVKFLRAFATCRSRGGTGRESDQNDDWANKAMSERGCSPGSCWQVPPGTFVWRGAFFEDHLVFLFH